MKKVRKLLLLMGALVIGLAGGVYVYAKYYSISAREGIAIATGVYFTANYAVPVTEDGEFVESLVNSAYAGGDTSYDFEIRNYENNLLFNTSDVDIPYAVSFWLGGEITDGTTYSVRTEDGENTQEHRLSTDRVVFLNQNIRGGSAKANRYTITIDTTGQTHKPIPIYVEARTQEGSLINRILRGKMLLDSSDMTVSYIESQQFIVPDESEAMTPEEKFASLCSLAALTYEIRTVGDVTSTGELTEELKLKWDPDVLQMDLFDEAYLEWKETTGEPQPLTDTDGWNYIVIKAMPYASENIIFFRGDKFDAEAADLDTLHGFIKAEKYAERTP